MSGIGSQRIAEWPNWPNGGDAEILKKGLADVEAGRTHPAREAVGSLGAQSLTRLYF